MTWAKKGLNKRRVSQPPLHNGIFVKHKALFNMKKFYPYSYVRKSNNYRKARNICLILQKNGYEAYFVGGAVRDMILNPKHIPQDIDIATSATPEQIHELFIKSHFVGQVFGVSMVESKGKSFEVATFRKEGVYVDKRHPLSISLGDFSSDSCRRDFTINCLYFDPIKKRIKDPHAGLQDLKNKVLKCVGKPEERLQEDALRIIRLIRFSANLNFRIEEKTWLAAKKEKDGLYILSKERVVLEIQKIIGGRSFDFFEKLNKIEPLTLLFLSKNKTKDSIKFISSVFHNNIAKSVIKLDTTLPIFNTLKFILFSYNFNFSHLKHILANINEMPTTSIDKKICEIFLKSIFIEKGYAEKTDKEVLDFLFFENLLKIKSISPENSRRIFLVMLLFIDNNIHKETLYRTIESHGKESLNIDSEEISDLIIKLKIDKKYISAIIKYIQYIYTKRFKKPKLEHILAFKNQFFIEYFNAKEKN